MGWHRDSPARRGHGGSVIARTGALFEDARLEVIRALGQKLPGADAWVELVMERYRERVLRRLEIPSSARAGAVLIALTPSESGLEIPLIHRADDGGPHSGQVALPGGGAEPSDRDASETALRESWEEITLPPGSVEILGALTPLYIPVSSYAITPVVGWCNFPGVWSTLKADSREVQQIIRADVGQLRASRQTRSVSEGARRLRVPSYATGEHIVWGATAMMLAELFEVLSGHLSAS